MPRDVPRALAAAAHLVTRAREKVAEYAGIRAPIATHQIADLLRRSSAQLCIVAARSDMLGMAPPPLAGIYPIIVARDTPRTERAFIIRHELAHVLAGDAGAYLTADDADSHAERVADLFALADLVPGHLLSRLQRDLGSPAAVLKEVRAACWDYASLDWTPGRVDDRAELRMRLWREWGI